MKVVSEILSREEMLLAQTNGLPYDIKYGILFESEQEANDYKGMLKELMDRKMNQRQ
jgi:hypothetical protein